MNVGVCNQPTTIRLYGEMGRLFGRVHRVMLDRPSATEALQYLKSQYPKITEYLTNAKDRGIGFSIFYGTYNISEAEIGDVALASDIRIAPIIMGSKKSGVLQIIVGAVLIFIGLAISGFSFGTLTPLGAVFVAAGVGMIAGGIVSMLTPTPKGLSAKDNPANTPSYSFNGPINTEAQGHPVPYFAGGPMPIGSAVGSAGISVTDTATAYQPPLANSGHMGYGGDLYAGKVVVP